MNFMPLCIHKFKNQCEKKFCLCIHLNNVKVMKLADINFKFFNSFEGELVRIKHFYPYKQMLI